ncbi:HAD family phosphatase [Lactococcus garvieae]|nr:HAD family phosphatase [Lactococcus garvieae]
MSFNTIIFDMDGVLIDTKYHYAQVFDAFFDKKGIPIAHLNRRELLGRPLRDLWPFILGEDFDKKDAARLQKEFFTYKKSSHFPIEEMLFPDVKVVLQCFSETKLKIGLATSSSHDKIAEVLDTHNLRKYFEVISSGEDFPESKPHPAVYLSAMKQLNARASDVLVIEDSPNGISAGATVWAIRDQRFDSDQSQADRRVEHLTEVLELLGFS